MDSRTRLAPRSFAPAVGRIWDHGETKRSGLARAFTRWKASSCKRLLPWVAEKLQAYQGHGREGFLAALGGWGLVEFVSVLDASPRHMSEAAMEAAARGADAYLGALQELSHAAAAQGLKVWKVRPKVHYFMHLVARMRMHRRNPRFDSVWNNEDFVGRIGRIIRKAHARRACSRLMERYLLLLGHRRHKAAERLTSSGRWTE